MFGHKTTKFATKNRATILPAKPARLINDITAVLLFAFAVVIGGMLFTYSPDDQCWFKIAETNVIHNKFGLLGSYIADIIFSVFGESGWWLVVGIFYLGYRKIIRDNINTGNWYSIFQIISFIFLIISSCIFEYLSLYYTPSTHLHNGNGGLFGHLLYNLIAGHIGHLATTILVLLCLITFFSFAFSLSILNIAEKIGFVIEFIYLGFKRAFGGGVNASPEPEVHHEVKNSDDEDEELVENKVVAASIKQKIAQKFTQEQTPPKTPAKPDPDDYSSMLDGNAFRRHEVTKAKSEPISLSTLESIDYRPKILKEIAPEIVEDEESELELEIEKPVRLERTVTATPALKPRASVSSANGLPSTSLLNNPTVQLETISQETLEFVSMSIENKLAEFGVEAKILNAESGPVITRYELMPSRGVRGEKVVGLSKEIARGLSLTNVRIVETIPGKNSMGIEVPNFKRKIIYLKEIFDSPVYQRGASKLTLALGKDIAGTVVVTDLAKMPHLLVAGTTGSGKSVAVNAMILSILFQATPDEVKFIMIDPKMVELSFYQDIPHLLAPVVTDMTQAANALKWTVGEMERRYKTMAKIGCKNIISLNQKILDAENSGNPILNPYSATGDEEIMQKWPYIVVIIDELADLMMVTGKKTEQYIARIAQKARAVGIHLIVATQRPSVDVITGLIKANIPARISFQVSSKIDSRTILDQMGAEALLGQGDMLFLQPGSGFPQRIHGAYVNDDELNKVVDFLKSTGKPEYLDEILTGNTDGVELPGLEDESNGNDTEKDPMFDESVKFIYDTKRCSISSLQTRFGIGYNRAARIMAHLETIGMVKRNERGGFEIIKTNNT